MAEKLQVFFSEEFQILQVDILTIQEVVLNFSSPSLEVELDLVTGL